MTTNNQTINQSSQTLDHSGIQITAKDFQKFLELQQQMMQFYNESQGWLMNGLKPQIETNDELRDKFFDKLIENRRSHHTIDTYRIALNDYFKWLGGKKVADIEFEEALDYIRYLRREENGVRVFEANTINTKHSAISSFYSYLKKTKNYVRENFFSDEHIAQLPEEEVNIEVTYLSQVEVEQFLRTIANSPNNRGTLSRIRDYVMYRLMIGSGLRIAEATQLELRDLNFETGILTVRNEIAKKGRGRETKLDKGLEPFIGEYLKEREKLNPQTDILFLNQLGNKINPRRSLKAIKRYAEEAGIWKPGKPITNHTLRHTFATIMVSRGESLSAVSKMLGHSSPDFSYKHYVSNTAQEVKEDVYEGLFGDHDSMLNDTKCS